MSRTGQKDEPRCGRFVGFGPFCFAIGLLQLGSCAHASSAEVTSVPAVPRGRFLEGKLQTPFGGVQASQENLPCVLAPVYFGYDSALIDERVRDEVIATVSCFTRHGMPTQLKLTGATDPRGTEEYNLALGHRRAIAVQNLLLIMGIAPARISVASIGEEIADGRDEEGWKLDRRVVASSEP